VRLWASSAFVGANVLSGVLLSRFGLVVVVWWLVVAGALNLATIYCLPAPPPDHAPGPILPRLGDMWRQARELMASPVFLIFLAAASLDQGSHAFYYTYGGLHWRALGYSGWLIGTIWPLGVLTEIAFMSVSLRLFRRIGAARLLVLGSLSCVLRWSVLAFDPPLAFVILVQFLHGGTFALAHLGAMYFVREAVPPRLAATAQSLYAVCSTGIAMGAATYACGPLYAAYGGHAYLLMAAMGAGASGFALWLDHAWAGARVIGDVHDGDLVTI
jgi:PPP family 3-phenylpropionic acid transporter